MTLHSERAPVFILGCPRSGTTFLSSMLALTEFGPPFESQFIVKYFDRLRDDLDLSDRGRFGRIARGILEERAVRQWRIDIDVDQLFESLETKTYPALADAICLAMVRSRRPAATAWGDKTPRYTLRWDVLLRLYPESRFIYISRDGRAVALSLLRRPWGPGTIVAAARLWRSYIDIKRDLEDRLGSDQILFVRYEELLLEAEPQIHRLYEFLDVGISADEVRKLAATAKRDNAFKWRSKMTEADRKLFETVVAATLENEGYETRYPQDRLPTAAEISSAVRDGAKRGRHLLVQNLVDPIAIRFFGKEPFND